MRFEVPQFIEIEDKIVGPLTWKQFVYLAGGVGVLVVLFFSDIPFIFFILIGLPIGALTAALAFHQVNNRPFSIFLESVLRYISHSRLYLWRREMQQSIIEKEEKVESPAVDLAPAPKQSIHTLSRKLDLPLSE
jgi:hypothetical protein